MVATTQDRTLPLPKGWPRRVRSAVVHAISLAHFSPTATRGWAANDWNARVRLEEESDRFRQEISLLREEFRIKHSRMERIPAQRRPHYPPIERLAILELRAARGWSLAQTARRLLVTPLTIASWSKRLDEEGPDALVQVPEPVNRFPEFVRYLVRRLRALCPSMGTRRIAQVLARAGLHLGATTVRRMLRPSDRPQPAAERARRGRIVTAKRPNHVWHLDLTTIPTSSGFWISWVPSALPQRWPFCWWIAVSVDHYSRRVMGTAVFRSEPSALELTTFLTRLRRRVGCLPRHLITDHGVQFIAKVFQTWCRSHGIQQRFGAIGKYGSLAVVERFIRSLKTECTRALLVPFARVPFQREIDHYVAWFNAERDPIRVSAPEPRLRSTSGKCLRLGNLDSSRGDDGPGDRRARDPTRSFVGDPA